MLKRIRKIVAGGPKKKGALQAEGKGRLNRTAKGHQQINAGGKIESSGIGKKNPMKRDLRREHSTIGKKKQTGKR